MNVRACSQRLVLFIKKLNSDLQKTFQGQVRINKSQPNFDSKEDPLSLLHTHSLFLAIEYRAILGSSCHQNCNKLVVEDDLASSGGVGPSDF